MTNRLIVRGEPERVQALISYVKTEDTPFSFDKIIQMPIEMEETDIEDIETEELKAISRRNKSKFGHESPYAWRFQYWGTIVDAAEGVLTEGTGIEFLAAILSESISIEYVFNTFDVQMENFHPLIQKLSRCFPMLRIEHDYIEEMPYFGGSRTYENGNCLQSAHMTTRNNIWDLSAWHETFAPPLDDE